MGERKIGERAFVRSSVISLWLHACFGEVKGILLGVRGIGLGDAVVFAENAKGSTGEHDEGEREKTEGGTREREGRECRGEEEVE